MLDLFKKHTGYTIGEFLTIKRIHHAKKLLRETQLKISEVCYQSGFNDGSHFAKVFKSHEKLTPHAFRKVTRDSLMNKHERE